MGPTKALFKDGALYDAKTGALLKTGLTTHEEIQDYAAHHYIVLPMVDHACRPWILDGQLIYCLRGSRYETLDDKVVPLVQCPDCGGMGIREEEPTVESDCIRCTQCGHEFDARLEMMES
ncbi:MAG: hypothetical protein D6704_05830 [Nitrospirae bacterium]|nr:MAG: hypothetical protein D6704_05830 [Nitrospirota bacterium]